MKAPDPRIGGFLLDCSTQGRVDLDKEVLLGGMFPHTPDFGSEHTDIAKISAFMYLSCLGVFF
jgi:hypothetical protein